jgi:Nucleotidyltransferase of unknown function (DUF6036)
VSQRSPVDRQRITEFLTKLGERYRGRARLYLVGGTTIVFENYRTQTLDIDLTFEVEPADESRLVQAIRELREDLNINVEQVSPGDFIPLPAGYQNRGEFVGRFGGLDVFHFDLYSTALSKVERGSEQDFADVLSLLQAGRIEWAKLRDFFTEILGEFGAHSLKQDPIEFEQNFRALAGMAGEAPGPHGG